MRRFVYVAKASKPNPPGDRGKDEEWRGVHAASDSTSPQVAIEFVNAVRRVGDEISPELVAKLLDMGALDRIVDHQIDWQFLEILLRRGIQPELIRAVKAAADHANAFTAATLKDALGIVPELQFNSHNPRLLRWIQQNTGEMIRGITDESRAAVKGVVGRILTEELPSDFAFTVIKDSIGLNERQAIAAQNVYHAGIEQGLSPDEAMRESSAYAERALAQRANAIARTESMNAANQGQNEGWEQAADAGYFDRNSAEVEWVTTPDDRLCPTCAEMDGVRRPFDGTWIVTILDEKGRARGTKEVDNPSQIHPMCRCTSRLVLND